MKKVVLYLAALDDLVGRSHCGGARTPAAHANWYGFLVAGRLG